MAFEPEELRFWRTKASCCEGMGGGCEKFCDSDDTELRFALGGTGEGARSWIWSGEGGAGRAAGRGGRVVEPGPGIVELDAFLLCVDGTGLRCCQGSVLLGGVDGGLSPDMSVRGGRY